MRARGFEGESAFLALYLNIFAPSSFVWVRARHGRLAALAFLACAAGAFAVTFSAAGATGLVIGLCAGILLYVTDHGFAGLPLRNVALAVAVATLAIGAAAKAPEQVRLALWNKVTFAGGSSANKRLAAWKEAFPVAEESPFLGTGVGSTSQETGEGVISFYLTMLKEAGDSRPDLDLFLSARDVGWGRSLVGPKSVQVRLCDRNGRRHLAVYGHFRYLVSMDLAAMHSGR